MFSRPLKKLKQFSPRGQGPKIIIVSDRTGTIHKIKKIIFWIFVPKIILVHFFRKNCIIADFWRENHVSAMNCQDDKSYKVFCRKCYYRNMIPNSHGTSTSLMAEMAQRKDVIHATWHNVLGELKFLKLPKCILMAQT